MSSVRQRSPSPSHLRRHSGRVADQPRSDPERRARPDANVARSHLQRTREGNTVRTAASNTWAGGPCREERENDQHQGYHDLLETILDEVRRQGRFLGRVDAAHPTCGVGDHGLEQPWLRRRTNRRDGIHGRRQAIVEFGMALFDYPGNLSIVRHPSKWRERPDQGNGDEHDKRQADERQQGRRPARFSVRVASMAAARTADTDSPARTTACRTRSARHRARTPWGESSDLIV